MFFQVLKLIKLLDTLDPKVTLNQAPILHFRLVTHWWAPPLWYASVGVSHSTCSLLRMRSFAIASVWLWKVLISQHMKSTLTSCRTMGKGMLFTKGPCQQSYFISHFKHMIHSKKPFIQRARSHEREENEEAGEKCHMQRKRDVNQGWVVSLVGRSGEDYTARLCYF